MMPHELPSIPWEKVGSCYHLMEDIYYLITVDYKSNLWEVDRLPDTESSMYLFCKKKTILFTDDLRMILTYSIPVQS